VKILEYLNSLNRNYKGMGDYIVKKYIYL